MVGLGPHRAGSHQPKPARSKQQGNFPNPERDRNEENGRFREGSVDTTQTSRSHSHVGSHVSQKQNDEQAMQREINNLKRKGIYNVRNPPGKGIEKLEIEKTIAICIILENLCNQALKK